MRNDLELHWWGFRLYLDEDNTRNLLSAGDVATTAAGLAGLIPHPVAKIAAAVGVAAAKIDLAVVKFVDQNGGSHGVCLCSLWSGNLNWVEAQEA